MNRMNNEEKIPDKLLKNFKKNKLRLYIIKRKIYNNTKKYVVRLRGEYFTDFEIERAYGNKFTEINKKQIRSFIFIDTNVIKQQLAKLSEEFTDDLIDKANLVLNDFPIIFDNIYETSVKSQKGDYLWNADFINKVTYPKKLFYDINLKEYEGEIKVPWEFARLQILITLAQAYLITNDKIYIDKFIHLIESFNHSNPCGFGVNWMNSMEVGIRIFNILSSYTLLKDEIDDDDDIHNIINKMAIEHGLYIYKNLEKTGKDFSNNHYIANLLGLISIVSAYPKIEFSKKITNFVLKEFEYEIEKQILTDGLSFEGTASYTRLIGECFYYALLIMNRLDLKVSTNYLEKLSRVCEALEWLETNNGCTTQIGDNDSGKAIILSYRDALDYSYLPELIDIEINNKYTNSENTILERIFLYGDVFSEKIHNTKVKGIHLFDDSNIIVYKTEEIYFLFTASDPLGKGVPGHMHNDKLSFVFQFRGKDFFIDPGTGSYTANRNIRNILRGTSSHNTVMINNEEQNRFTNSVFGYIYDGSASFSYITESDKLKIFGETDCYLQRIGVTHCRDLSIESSKITIVDKYKNMSDSIYSTCTNFSLHPDVKICRINDNNILLAHDDTEIIFMSENKVTIEENYYSDKYNEWKKTKVLRVESYTNCSSKVEVKLNVCKK